MAEPRPIFILANMRAYGGAEKSLATLVPHLAEAAPLRIFVENDRHYDELQRLGLNNVELVRFGKGSSPVSLVSNLALLYRHFRHARPQALLANGHKGALMMALLRLLAPRSKAQWIIYIRDFGYYTLPFILRQLPKALFVAPSQAIFDYEPYIKQGLTRHRCEVIPNAVKLPDHPGKGNGASIPPATPFIACCARITPWKGIEYLIKAFPEVAAAYPDVQLRIYGDVIDHDYFEQLKALAASSGTNGHIVFERFAGDMDTLYRQALFLVIPSLSMPPGPESFSRIIVEAWAHQKTVIAFAAGGPRYLIEDGTDGFLVEEKNVAQLSQCMKRLLEDAALRKDMGARGYEKVRDHHQPEVLADRLLHRLIGEPTRTYAHSGGR